MRWSCASRLLPGPCAGPGRAAAARAGTLSEIREALEESLVPYTVDLVDLCQTEDAFRAVVLREGILWSD